VAYAVAERVAITALLQATSPQQDLYVANVESEMRRYAYLPRLGMSIEEFRSGAQEQR
jgi:C4-dicarboxylate-specific signal transduction histidine kinase